MKNLALSFGLLALLIAGCSEDKKVGGAPAAVIEINNKRFYVLEGSARNDAGVISSPSAVIASADPLAFELNKFELSFKLEDGGSFTVLSNGAERLSGAATVKFVRTGNAISAIDAQVPGGEVKSLLAGLPAGFDASGQIDLVVEVHQEGATHILVYPKGGQATEDGEAQFAGLPAAHKTWGLKLEKASLVSQNVVEGSEE